jgi:DNA-binding IclR family transcriptional regulator
MTVKSIVRAATAVDIFDVLADVPCATLRRIADDTGRDPAGLSRMLPLMIERRLVEPAGYVTVYGTQRRAMTYRLHPRVREMP